MFHSSRERLSDSAPVEISSWEDYERKRKAAIAAQHTDMTVENGYEAHAMYPEKNIHLKKWDGK